MDQVIDDVDVVESRDQRIDVTKVAAGDLRLLPPGHVGQLVRVACQRANAPAVVQQSRHQAATDVAGRSRHQAANLFGHRCSVPHSLFKNLKEGLPNRFGLKRQRGLRARFSGR